MSRDRSRIVFLLSWIAGSLLCCGGSVAQEGQASRFGVSTQAPSSTQGAGGGSAYGGGASWTAGQGSFGTHPQDAGVWHDGSILGAPRYGARTSIPDQESVESALPTSAEDFTLSPVSLKPFSTRAVVLPSSSHLVRAPSGLHAATTARQGMSARSSGLKFAAIGTRVRTGYPTRSSSGSNTHRTSGRDFASRYQPPSSAQSDRSFLYDTPDTQVKKHVEGTLP
jgi:hypothetical protein